MTALRVTLAALLLAAVAGCGNGSGPLASPSPSAPAPSPSAAPSATSTTAAPTPAPPATPVRLMLRKLGEFSSPVWAAPAPGDPTHLYLVEKTGLVLQLDAQGRRTGVLLDLTGQVSSGNEQGLLSVAFDPAYATNNRFYANYTDRDGDTRVVAYTVVGGKATRPQQLLQVDQPFANHNGGLLLFDRTGMLLVGMGDGGSAGDPGNHAQDLSDPLGKILRLDPRDGQAAPGNPYPENRRVWAYGLRNPWRFSFDLNGDLFVADVGQNKIEELNVVPQAQQRGANYGWSVFEGNDRFSDRELQGNGTLIKPALTYRHSDGGCSITGGAVYRGSALPSLVGTYVFGDYCAGKLLGTTRTATGLSPSRLLGPEVDGLQAFGLDIRGELLVLSADALYRLVAA